MAHFEDNNEPNENRTGSWIALRGPPATCRSPSRSWRSLASRSSASRTS